MTTRVLVVDDDEAVVDLLVEGLGEAGFAAERETSALAALARVVASPWDLVIADVQMPEMRGTELMREIHAQRPDQLVLLITAFGSIDLAVDAVRAGACDFVTKPFKMPHLVEVVGRVIEERTMRRDIVRVRRTAPAGGADLVARSPAMRRVLELARRAAQTDMTVLITGESGVGKGAVAHYIHRAGVRSDASLVQINCAALPPNLIESELFGVRKGAYTDAREDRPGLFVKARGGTLFLDEVAELPMDAQPKLLQALETGRVRPVGGTQEVAVDARVLAATNRPLEDALRDRTFRSDLYYRLNVIRVEVPPLRERREDIEPLADLFLERVCRRLNRPVVGIAKEAWRWLLSRPWPGNVRQLAHALERAVALTDHDVLVLDDLTLAAEPAATGGDFLTAAAARGLTLAEVELTYIEKVLEVTGGNKIRAAEVLGIDRRTLYRRLSKDSDE